MVLALQNSRYYYETLDRDLILRRKQNIFVKLTNSKQRPRHLKAFTPIHVTYLRDNGFLDGKSSRERTDLSEPVSG